MESFWVTWLGALALVAIVLAWLLGRLYRCRDFLSWILLLCFALSLGFIWTKWYLSLDLAMYDASKYHYFAGQIAGLLKADFWGNLPYTVKPYWAYTMPLGILYFLFGVSEPLGQTLNAVIGLGVVLNLHRLAHLWFSPRIADRTALLLALYPYFWVLSGTLNRDQLIVFCISRFFLALTEVGLKGERQSSFKDLVWLVGSLLYMTLLRPPLIILGGLALFVFWMTHPAATLRRHWLLRMGRAMVIFSVLGLGGLSYLLCGRYYLNVSPIERDAGRISQLDEMNARLRISEKAGSAYLKGVSYSSYEDVVQIMPLATLYFLLSPLPWQVTSFKQALGLLDSFWLLWVYIHFLRGLRDLVGRQRRLGQALITFLLLGVALSGVLQANASSAMRHRPMFTLLMFPVAVYGCRALHKRQNLKKGRWHLPGGVPIPSQVLRPR